MTNFEKNALAEGVEAGIASQIQKYREAILNELPETADKKIKSQMHETSYTIMEIIDTGENNQEYIESELRKFFKLGGLKSEQIDYNPQVMKFAELSYGINDNDNFEIMGLNNLSLDGQMEIAQGIWAANDNNYEIAA